MKRIDISHIDSISQQSPLPTISQQLDTLEKKTIDEVSWEAYPYKPDVSFAIAYNDCLFIKYYVSEKCIRAVYNKPNGPVYKDSCVEFFISFNGEQGYYNLEFNCIGTCLLGYGTGRENRKLLPEMLINTIRHQSYINCSKAFETTDINWELTLVIPFAVFAYHDASSLKEKVCRGNFFKCGDELDEPHFLAWNKINTASPDFHLPQFFGELSFL